MAIKVSTDAVNAGLAAVGALLNSGKLRIYSGTRPTTTDDPITGTLLAELTFSNPAFGTPSAGSMAANALGDEDSCLADGQATHYRAWKSDGTTAVVDGDVGTSGADLNLNSVDITTGAMLSISSFTLTQPRA